MAEYVVALQDNAVQPFTTTPGQVDTVKFTENVERVAITSNGAGELRVTNDGTTPALGDPGESTTSYRLPAMPSIRELTMWQDADTLKILSSAPTLVSVEVVR